MLNYNRQRDSAVCDALPYTHRTKRTEDLFMKPPHDYLPNNPGLLIFAERTSVEKLFSAVFWVVWRTYTTCRSKILWTICRALSTLDFISLAPTGYALSSRPMRLFSPLYTGLGTGLALYLYGSGVSTLLNEIRLDNNYRRYLMAAPAPVLIWVSLFFGLQLITSLSYIFGPVSQYYSNSRYYSAIPPQPDPLIDENLPHITVELPVYRESLDNTIAPSIFSLKAAMNTYARQGGTSSIFVHDDGLQLLPELERQKRIAFYDLHDIGWVARPPPSPSPGGYRRTGHFKKASNMNYGLEVSQRLEMRIRELEMGEKLVAGVKCLEDYALEHVVDEMYRESGCQWGPWASNARALRMGEIVLIVDSDTLVPEDCFRDAAREFFEDPQIAIIQHESDAMQVAHHYFENAIAYFTRRANRSISMGCANGDVAPFVGHNAFLRWSALQDASFVDEADGVTKIWSESNVSEDFEMAIRLQVNGYITRWATYSRGGFKEGVSFTPDDELKRWQKYTYGCAELIFNPVRSWLHCGVIQRRFYSFLWSDLPFYAKITSFAYMLSYFALASGAALSAMNYGMSQFDIEVDGSYSQSFAIWLSCSLTMPVVGSVGYSVLEYRLGRRGLRGSLWENLRWIPFFALFFGGISMQLFWAAFSYLCSRKMTWHATEKDFHPTGIFTEAPKLWRRHKWILLGNALTLSALFLHTSLLEKEVSVSFVRDTGSVCLVSVMHLVFLVLLNPGFMTWRGSCIPVKCPSRWNDTQ